VSKNTSKKSNTTAEEGKTAPTGESAPIVGNQAVVPQHILRLQGPRVAPDVRPQLTHRQYKVGGKVLEVPINGELEVTEAQYTVITSDPLPKGFEWGEAPAEAAEEGAGEAEGAEGNEGGAADSGEVSGPGAESTPGE
jgi:hypothetical protein